MTNITDMNLKLIDMWFYSAGGVRFQFTSSDYDDFHDCIGKVIQDYKSLGSQTLRVFFKFEELDRTLMVNANRKSLQRFLHAYVHQDLPEPVSISSLVNDLRTMTPDEGQKFLEEHADKIENSPDINGYNLQVFTFARLGVEVFWEFGNGAEEWHIQLINRSWSAKPK